MTGTFNPSQQLLDNIDVAVDKFIEDLDSELYRDGYEVSGSFVGDGVDIVVNYKGKEPDKMPTIYLSFDVVDDGSWVAIPELSFPMLKHTIYEDYADTIHYWLDKWQDLGASITGINKYWFDAESYILDWLDGEYDD